MKENYTNKKLRVAINGFGRIGRNVLRAYLEKLLEQKYSQLNEITIDKLSLLQRKQSSRSQKNNRWFSETIEIVAINDVAERESLIHLLNYDSTHGRLTKIGFHAELNQQKDKLVISSADASISLPVLTIKLYSKTDPSYLPWQQLEVDLVLESSGMFRSFEGANKHLIAGAEQVIIGAAPFDSVDACIVMGVNDRLLTRDKKIISSVSCTTQALVPLMYTLDKAFGIQSAMMTEIHAVTADQNVLDQGHRDLRRSRASGYNIIPTTSSSINATTRVLPNMLGKINGHSIRVPTIDVAAIDVTFTFVKSVTLTEIKEALKVASTDSLQGIMGYTDLPLVSSDFLHQPESLIIDGQQVMQVGSQFKVFSWYDNEWGYANRLLEMCNMLSIKKNKVL